MKAIVYAKYGPPDVLQLEEVEKPAHSETGEAIRYLEEGHAQGKVVITVEHNNKI